MFTMPWNGFVEACGPSAMPTSASGPNTGRPRLVSIPQVLRLPAGPGLPAPSGPAVLFGSWTGRGRSSRLGSPLRFATARWTPFASWPINTSNHPPPCRHDLLPPRRESNARVRGKGTGVNHPIHYPALRSDRHLGQFHRSRSHSTQVVFLGYPFRGTIFTAIITRRGRSFVTRNGRNR